MILHNRFVRFFFFFFFFFFSLRIVQQVLILFYFCPKRSNFLSYLHELHVLLEDAVQPCTIYKVSKSTSIVMDLLG
jgi:hypothetical protein